MQLLNAVRTVYNASIPLSLALTSGAFFGCGRNGRPTIPFFGTIDLHDLARHGRIEHDGSLAHADAEPHTVFAPTTPDQELLKDMLAEAEGAYLSVEDLVRVRSKRNNLLANEGRPLDGIHGMPMLWRRTWAYLLLAPRVTAAIACGEIALMLSILGDGQKVSSESVKQWMGEGRLPVGWTGPQRTQGVADIFVLEKKIAAAVDQMNARREAE
jgi:Peroxidase, family 2